MPDPKKIKMASMWEREGILVEYIKSKGDIIISGWYDNSVGIEGTRMQLSEFFEQLGIDEAACRKAFREIGRRGGA